MKVSPNSLRIGIASAIIVGTIGWLAYSGYGSSKSYYVTVPELATMGAKAYHSQLRVEGFVQPGSIVPDGTQRHFVLNEFESHSPKAASGRLLKVVYKGTEPPPDTFKDDARRWQPAATRATASFARLLSRPSAPANTRLSSPALRRSPQPPASQPLHPVRPQRLIRQPRPPQTDRMNAIAIRPRWQYALRAVRSGVQALWQFRRSSPASPWSFEPGHCYVLLGPNGAGKSTLLRILAGLLRPSHGTVRVFGDSEPLHARARIGYMSHAPMLYDELTAEENLQYFRSLYQGRACLTPAEALRQVGLDPELTRLFGQYSQGMRQRTSLARVLLPQPELLLLDEPFSNMDVESARQMVTLLAGFRQSDRTIVLTTHQRELAAPIADCVITLHAGRVASLEPGSPTR